ncbi:MAG: hypothetical protein BJ554DRAFT_5190 [Olpidium bornovanus]|uniref:STEEP1 domain-containing protein n=1 Tax=Olpidium bornovanus TaxID=278681 RepID=A0A8H7ZZI4_9FUNG|nr:MAG: hypothetical protein BJ554DRAFT_5190 [Olpidium bornovanus]
MPKVVARWATSSSLADCICGEYICILDTSFESLPRRQTDRAYIIPQKTRAVKFNVKDGETVFVKRPKGFEKQFRKICPRCHLWVAYWVTEARSKAEYAYVVEGAVAEDVAATKMRVEAAADAAEAVVVEANFT